MSIRFEEVSFSYDGALNALDALTLEIPDGSLFGIVGHTGSGKSTLLQLANALLIPDAGRVTVDGMDTSVRKTQREIRAKVGLAFQFPERQLFAATIAEDLCFGPRNLGLDAKQAEQNAREAMASVGLEYDALAGRSPFALSGGQQRRVALAGILAMKPQYLVLDEPAAGMDPAANAELLNLLQSLHRSDLTVVIVSHSMEDVARICTHLAVLDSGKTVACGTPQEVFAPGNAAQLAAMGLGLPNTVAFAQELASRGLELDGVPLTTEQLADYIAESLAGN